MAKDAMTSARVSTMTLEDARRRFEHWRRTRRCRTAVPAELWSAAVAVARVHGVNATADALRLDYYRLKARMSSAATPPPVTFVEARVPPAPERVGEEYLIELERTDGGRMRARVATLDALAVLSESFWRGRS
jgi:hypothetical protein